MSRLRTLLATLLRRTLVLFSDAVGIVIMLLLAVLAFLLFTESGAALALRETGRWVDMVQFEGVEGRLWNGPRLQQFRYEDDSILIVVEGADLRWSLPALLMRRVSLARLHAQTVEVTIKPTPADAEPPAEDSGALTQLPIGLVLRNIAVQHFRLMLPDTEPIVLDDITLAGSWLGDRVEIKHVGTTTPWVGYVIAEAAAQLQEDGVQIDRLAAHGFVEAKLAGRFGYSNASDLKLQWEKLQWPPQVADGASPDVTSARGQLHWTGQLDDYRYQVEAALAAAGIDFDIKSDGSGSLERLRADALDVRALDGRVQAQADIDWSGPLKLDASGRVDNLDPSKFVPELKGQINGRFEARTVLEGEKPRVDFKVQLADSTLSGYPLTLDASGRYADDAVDVAQARLSTGGTVVVASGRAWPQLDLKASLNSPRLAALWPELAGQAELQLTARGEPASPHVTAKGQVRALRYGDIRLAQADIDADVDLKQRINLDLTLRDLDAGTQVSSLRFSAHGPIAAHAIELRVATSDGDVRLDATGALDIAAPAWRGQITAGRLAPTQLRAWTLEAPAALVLGSEITLEPACWISADARACAQFGKSGSAQRLAFRLEGFDLAYLQPLLPDGTEVQLTVDGTGMVEFGDAGLGAISAELSTSAGELRQQGLPSLQLLPAKANIAEAGQGLQVDVELPFAEGGVWLKALLAGDAELMQRPLSGSLRVTLPDLSFLRVFSRELQQVSGRLDGELTLAGTLAQPQPQGALNVSEGLFRLATPGIELREVQAQLAADGSPRLTLSASARSGDGLLGIDGVLEPQAEPLRLELRIKGDNFQAVRIPDASAWISPDLQVRLADQALYVTGTIDVPRAEITPKTLDSGVGPSSDQVIVRSDTPASGEGIAIHADVRVRFGDAVRFEGFGLKTRLAGNLQLIEEPGVPTSGRGEINLVEGRYKAYGQDLSIETGKLIFSGGAVTQPALELRATRKPRDDITVGVTVRGTLEKPQFALFSTPAMPQDRQLSWLVLGRAMDEGSNNADKEMVADAALSLGLAGGEWLAQRLGGKIGVDEISLGAKPGESNDQAKLTVGKYLSPRLYISYGIGLFQQGHTFRLQYDIGRGFKLATESGVESGGDILYTIESKAKLRPPQEQLDSGSKAGTGPGMEGIPVPAAQATEAPKDAPASDPDSGGE